MLSLVSVGLALGGALVTGFALRYVRPKAVRALLLVFGVSALAVGIALLADWLVLQL